ncbi:MAG: hypothetical protein VKK80_12980 [Prochlorothrix sp.]|nr:hypothetical protein [Prochlorothrix sp.]
MNLDAQLQALVDQAPQDGQTPDLIQAIGPGLLELAQQLRCTHYFALQSRGAQWVTTILSNRNQPDQEKTVVYAYATPEDAQRAIPGEQRLEVQVIGLPVIHLLFQLIALEPVDSLLVFEEAGDRSQALEITRSELQTLVKTHLQLYKRRLPKPTPPYPPNLA